ncbi:MAG: esterase [Acidobacteria bacterium]|nr:esterase [Acidobacteriota bacterium]|tara:strand:+ start:149 stop:1075 length:927 start_codon:yes stop_codon:yes gene_type:complete
MIGLKPSARRAVALAGALVIGAAGPALAQARAAWVDPDRTPPSGMRYRTFHSAQADGDVSYLVYLPPDYEAAATRRYPVIYWMHGLGGRQAGGARLAARLDRGSRAGEAPAVIVVSINGLRASMYSDSKDGLRPVESMIVDDLVPHVDATYRTVPQRQARAVAGMSMGGYGTFRLGFKYPEFFGVMSSFAAALHTEATLAENRAAIYEAVYGGDADYARQNTPWTLAEMNADAVRGRTVIRQIIGTADGLLEWNRAFHRLLEQRGVEHDYIEVPDVAHDYDALAAAIGNATFEFYRRAFGEGTESATR